MNNVVPLTTSPAKGPYWNYSYPIGDSYRLFRVCASDSESMAYLPELVVRALRFIHRYHAETDPAWLAQLLYNNLKNSQTANFVFALVAVDQNNKIAAHSISYIDTYGSLGNVAIQLQMELRNDPPIPYADKKKMREIGRDLIEDWVKSLKLNTILAYAFEPALARLHKRDGFGIYRVLVKKVLEG